MVYTAGFFTQPNETLEQAQDNKLNMVCQKLQLINLAHIQGHSFTEQPVTQEMLLAADEIFVSNSIIGIWPVRQIGQHHFAIGPITRQLQAGLMQVMRGNRCAN